MRCPNCGADVGESPFCPQCGADLTSKVRSHRRFIRNLDRGVRHGLAAGITLVAAICVIVVVLSAMPSDDDPASASLIPEEALELGSGYVVLLEGFDDTFSAEVDDGTLVMTLDRGVARYYEEFVWEFRDVSGATAYVITKDEAELSWIEPSNGFWTVTVYCRGESGEAVLTGSLAYLCDLSTTYVWQHGGRTLSAQFSMSLEDYLALATAVERNRSLGTLAAALSFIDAGGAAASLEAAIWASYSSVFDGGRTSSDYADCILSMVSSCLAVSSDMILYGQEVRWAHPGETLFLGTGDTGDIAVLAASLLGAAGFDVALAKLPDMWAVGVAGVDAGTPADGYGVLKVASDGRSYLLCDVTDHRGLGVMPSRYSYDGSILYYGEEMSSGCGLAVCTF